MKLIPFLIFFSLLASCNEYWWTRGQPPATDEILGRASYRALEENKEYHEKRPEIAEIVFSIESSFAKIASENFDIQKLNTEFELIENSLRMLEGQLSYGNRAPMHELSGQFRSFKDRIESSGADSVSKESLKLFGARVLFMLASELTVPAPSNPHSS